MAHFVATFLPYSGSWIYNQLVHLRSFRVVVLTRRRENSHQFPFEPVMEYRRPFRDAKFLPLKAVRKLYETILVPQWRFFAKVLRNTQACLLHAHFGEWGYRCLQLKQMTGVPLVTTFYGWDISLLPTQKVIWRQRYRQLFADGDLFLAEGPVMRQRLIDLGCPKEKVKVHHLGVAVDQIAFLPRSLKPGEPVRFLAASNFTEKKGMPYIVEALAIVRKAFQSVRLTMVGDGPERPKVEALVQKNGLQDIVRFEGVVPYRQLLEIAYEHHLFVHPSVTSSDGNTEGGAPVVLLDMQATGMPVIATTHADIPEVVQDGKTGLLVPERDVEALASAMIELVRQPKQWLAMGQAARRYVEAEFNAARQAERLEQLYFQLIG